MIETYAGNQYNYINESTYSMSLLYNYVLWNV